MADRPLFNLDAEDRWRLAYDKNQWVIQRRAQKPRVSRLSMPLRNQRVLIKDEVGTVPSED